MVMLRKEGMLCAGIDLRRGTPVVCYQTGQMKEAEYLPLDFQGQRDREACFRKILSALKRYGRREELWTSLVLPETSEEEIQLYLKEAQQAGFPGEHLQIFSETESLVHFVMHQTSDIWQQNVWVLEFEAEEIRATCVRPNRRTMPVLVEVKEPEHWHVGSLLDGSRDDRLAELAKERFREQPASAVFLCGTEFQSQEYPRSREVICSHRRVFLAEQIYARGACMPARDTGKPGYLYLGEQTLLYNVGIRSSLGGRETLTTLISAGCSWYEAACRQEVLLGEDEVLEFVFTSMLGGEPICFGLRLTDIPRRPRGASRILLEIHFSGMRQCEIKATDLGFGELYPSSDLYWVDTVWLEEKEEDYGTGDYLQI